MLHTALSELRVSREALAQVGLGVIDVELDWLIMQDSQRHVAALVLLTAVGDQTLRLNELIIVAVEIVVYLLVAQVNFIE